MHNDNLWGIAKVEDATKYTQILYDTMQHIEDAPKVTEQPHKKQARKGLREKHKKML